VPPWCRPAAGTPAPLWRAADAVPHDVPGVGATGRSVAHSASGGMPAAKTTTPPAQCRRRVVLVVLWCR